MSHLRETEVTAELEQASDENSKASDETTGDQRWLEGAPSQTQVANAWQELKDHPRLRWLPPMWRTDNQAVPSGFELCAIEQNLRIQFEQSTDGLRFVLMTGPLEDLVRMGAVDPLTPAVRIDGRLKGEGRTFEEALVCLADKVRQNLG